MKEPAASARGLLLAVRVRRNNLTYLELAALRDLFRAVREVEARGIPGSIVEAGCALGGSAIMLAAAKDASRPLRLYDVFGMIPAPSGHDGTDVHNRYDEIRRGKAEGLGGDPYYGYDRDLLAKVRNSFSRFGYSMDAHRVVPVPGLYEDTLAFDEPVALAHVDCDWYQSVRVCLERIWPALSPGGTIVIDDYDAYSGCRKAVDEFVVDIPDCVVERRSRLHLRKDGGPATGR